jgi:YHS domain-containing protein
MRRALTVALCLVIAAACHQAPKKTASAAPAPQKKVGDMRSIDDIDPRPVVFDPPPMLRDEAAPPKPVGQPWEVKQPVPLTPEDEKMRAALPFTPAIAMDPIDGSKISMLARTPTFEYKGHIYYFSSEENKRAFASAPDQYVKGAFAHL